MISLSCGIAFGPKMFSGGISNVTRQYDGKRRSSRICSVVNVLSVLFIVCTHDLFVGGAMRSRASRARSRDTLRLPTSVQHRQSCKYRPAPPLVEHSASLGGAPSRSPAQARGRL